ncbi:MAG: cold shock domain-containing protein [Chromatiaceae bacterium]|nr:cold shock domain-containing protein [Chromatiaceae bacterium]
MRIEGTLSKWNDDRGFGFITPTQGGQEIFVHISAFPKDGVRPTLGESITFEIETDSTGKKRAKNLLCPQRPTVMRPYPSRKSPSYRRKESPGFFGRVIPLLLLVGLGVYGYGEYTRRIAPLPVIAAEPEIQETSSPYRCDGRTHCSQMTSCAEATFFLRNCPNTEMDGNHDGEPCEQQWCTSPFAK